MWSAVPGVIGLLAIVLNAEWLAGRWARARRRIRAEAEVLEHLPPGIGQRLLRARVDDAVLTYVVRRDIAMPRPIATRFWAWLTFGAAGLLTSVIGQIEGIFGDAKWANPVAWIGLAAMGLGTLGMRSVNKSRNAWIETERPGLREQLMQQYHEGYQRVLAEERRVADPSAEAPQLDVTPVFAGDHDDRDEAAEEGNS